MVQAAVVTIPQRRQAELDGTLPGLRCAEVAQQSVAHGHKAE
jgi:hypothetical protein